MDMPDLHLKSKSAGRRVQCIPVEGPWFDIGAFEDYDRACAAFNASPDLFLQPPETSPGVRT